MPDLNKQHYEDQFVERYLSTANSFSTKAGSPYASM